MVWKILLGVLLWFICFLPFWAICYAGGKADDMMEKYRNLKRQLQSKGEVMGKVEVFSSGLCYCTACVDEDMSIEEITEAVNKDNPTGIDHGWSLSEEKFASVCLRYKGKKHYLFSC